MSTQHTDIEAERRARERTPIQTGAFERRLKYGIPLGHLPGPDPTPDKPYSEYGRLP